MSSYGLLPSEEMREIRRRVLSNNRDSRTNYYEYSEPSDEFYGVLNADLAAATNPRTGYTNADVRILKYSSITTNRNLGYQSGSYGLVNVINRSESLSGARGTLCLIRRILEEYAFIWVDCEISSDLLGSLP